MESVRPQLVISEENKKLPVLIIDKKGFVGAALAEKLKEQFLVVLATGTEVVYHKNLIHIPYRRKIPVIPDNAYSHIFVVYSGGPEVLDMLPTFMKKAHASRGRLFLLMSLHYSSEKLFMRLSNHLYHELRVIVYGEIFDNNLTLGNMVNLFIHQVRRTRRIDIPNEGRGELYPVYLEDVLVATIAAAFSHETPHRTLFLFPKVAFSEMSVARALQQIDPEIGINFSEKRYRSFSYHIPSEGYYVFSNYSLLGALKKIDLSQDTHHRASGPEKRIRPAAPVRRKIEWRQALLVLVLLLLLPVVIVLISAGTGVMSLRQAVREAEQGNFAGAQGYATVGKSSFAIAQTVGANYVPAEFVATAEKAELVENLTAGRKAAGIAEDIFSSLNTFSGVYKLPEKSEAEFSRAVADTKNALVRLQEMRAQHELPESAEKRLQEADYMLSVLENTIDYYPAILGFEGKRKYLLLFQNNMELRPGGGFIGSYALVDIENGRAGKINIHDVYDADGKLTTHVEPPYALRRYGGVTHSFLRDSSFHIDYPNNALAARDLLKRSTGESVDGVIAIDTNVMKNLLTVLGTVHVDDYNENVTADNFYMLTQKHVEDNFFPGSTQKKDFLRALLNSMLTELEQKENLSYAGLIQAAEKSVKEKHLIIHFSEESVQEAFVLNGLSGVLADTRQKRENVITDFLAIFDANIGGNKGNYYLKRQVSQNVTIREGADMQATATVQYENTSKEDSKFGGKYRTYLRFALPEGADLQGIRIDDQEVPMLSAITNPTIFTAPDFIPPQATEVETTQVKGKEVVGFLVEVPVESRKKVTISYTIPQSVTADAPSFSYSLKLFKQPGTIEDPYALVLTYPSRFQPLDLPQGVVDLGGKVAYETKLTEDKDLRLRFTQK